MHSYHRTVTIPGPQAKRIRACMENRKCLPQMAEAHYTATFQGGYEMDVYIPRTGPMKAEAVLLHRGYRICRLEPREDFFGCWRAEADGKAFCMHVLPEK